MCVWIHDLYDTQHKTFDRVFPFVVSAQKPKNVLRHTRVSSGKLFSQHAQRFPSISGNKINSCSLNVLSFTHAFGFSGSAARKVLITWSTDGWSQYSSPIVSHIQLSPTSFSDTCTSTVSISLTWIFGAPWLWLDLALIWWLLITSICLKWTQKCRSWWRFIGSYGINRLLSR